MSQPKPEVEQFIVSVGRRVDRHRLFDVVFWAMIGGGALMLTIALCYVLFGARVPWHWYLAVLIATVAIAWCVDWCLRLTDEDAAAYADRFFGLKNSVRSWLGFSREQKQGGFYELQSAQTATLVQQVDINQIRYQTPWKLVVPGVALVAASALMGLKPESPIRIAARQQQADTLAMTEATNRDIKELLDELEQSVDDEDEKLLLEPDKLRQWVDELKETTDLHEAKRQYAKMEMKLNRAYEALEQRKDEQLLDKAAKELRKDFDSQELSKNLEHKKYERAADELKDLEPGDKNDKKIDPKKLSETRKELAKLKAAAKRMAAAARDTQGDGQSEDGEDAEDSEDTEDDLGDLLEDLEEATDEYDEGLEEIELLEGSSDQDLEGYEDELDRYSKAMRSKLDELGDHLKKMASRRKARSKLRKLSKRFSQAQSSNPSKRRGGKKAGKGSEDSNRQQRDERVDNGQNTKLKGIKGKGPSITQIQAADDGDGVSRLRNKATKREFKQQFESFVDREDIPDDLRTGVKNYFTNIHDIQDEEGGASPEGDSSGEDSAD